MAQEAAGIDNSGTIEAQLARAREAYENDDSKTVSDLCRAVVEVDPNNAEAWELLAKFGGWDSKMYTFDIDFAIDSAKHALALAPENGRYDLASEIYAAPS